jgi:hypothetical protein
VTPAIISLSDSHYERVAIAGNRRFPGRPPGLAAIDAARHATADFIAESTAIPRVERVPPGNPEYDRLRGDPRIKSLRKKVGLIAAPGRLGT